MDDEQQRHLEDLLRAYQRRLRPLERRAALQGLNTPPDVLFEIEDIQAEIARIEAKLSTKTIATTTSRSDDEYIYPTPSQAISRGLKRDPEEQPHVASSLPLALAVGVILILLVALLIIQPFNGGSTNRDS
jgi:hypothetical protein